MTDTLIARLRCLNPVGDSFQYICKVTNEAADRIEELQAKWKQFEEYDCDELKAAYALVDQLRAEVVDAKVIQAELQEVITEMCNAIPDYDWSGGAAEKIKAAFARLTALEGQEPVAWIIGMTESAPMLTSTKAFAQGARDIDGRDIKPLYLAAGAAPFQPDWANYRQGVEDGKAEALEAAQAAPKVDTALTIAYLKGLDAGKKAGATKEPAYGPLTEQALLQLWNYEASKSGHNTHELPARYARVVLEQYGQQAAPKESV